MSRTIKNTLIVLCLIVMSACSKTSAPVPIKSGSLTGLIEDGVTYYRGIPYAHPPVGKSRWRAPEPVDPWEDIFAAETYGPDCWQDLTGGNDLFLKRLVESSGMSSINQWLISTFASFATPEISEDCLTLNVMVPEGKQNRRLPVMFWIHGGGHQFGSGGTTYESPSLVNQDVVLVTINYRLGLYGFFAHEDLQNEDPNQSTGNYGMQDQLFALQWVQDNIAQFGGDPGNVTIFGESAGGHSVGQLMASPLSKDLFHRAIAESGTGFSQFQATNKNHERISGLDAGNDLLARSGVNTIDQLRELDTEALRWLAINPKLADTYHPQIDGYVLTKSTAEVFQAGEQMPVPLIVGSNADEGSLLYEFGLTPVDGMDPIAPQTSAEWQALMKDAFGDKAKIVEAAYAVDTHVQVPLAAAQLMGDTWFGRHAFYMAEFHANIMQPTYLYFYERTPPSDDQTIGAGHALELNHVFGGLIPGWPSDERDDELTTQMQGHWTQFAKIGDPNRVNLPTWTAFERTKPQEMAYGHTHSNSRPVARQVRYEAMRTQFKNRIPEKETEKSTGSASSE